MIYDYLGKFIGKERYRITLKIYRDCSAATPFDGPGCNGIPPAIITVRDGDGNLVGLYDVGAPVIAPVPPSINSKCINVPFDVCVEVGVYTTTLTLPLKDGGYYIIYQRCCRNATINNLLLPGSQGSTYYTKIPGSEEVAVNSSARFKNFPPIYVCANKDFTFDHSATDSTIDRLEYSFYDPLLGCTQSCPALRSSVCPSLAVNCPGEGAALPYSPVNYVAPYSGTYPIASNPAFYINPVTGLLTGRPNLIGQFVVGICVKEYRNDKLINTLFRDFQFNVRACAVSAVSSFKEQTNICNGSIITFTNQSVSSSALPSVRWDFGVPGTNADTSTLFNPTYNFPDTGKFTVTLIVDAGKLCPDTSRRDCYVYPELDVCFNPPRASCLKNNIFDFSAYGKYGQGADFNWDFTNAASPPTSKQKDPLNVSFTKGGRFNVTLSSRFGLCRDTCTALVYVLDPESTPAIHWDTSVVIGQAIPLNAYVGPGYTYTWTPQIDFLDCSPCLLSNPQSLALSDITYTVLLEDSLQCGIRRNTYRVHIENKVSLDVPTAFTPDGDGVNDIIYVEGWGLKKLVSFKIFNRWGQLLFESNDLKVGWDGKYNGLAQNMETYVYQALAETYLTEPATLSKTGSFRLIR